MFFFFPPVTTRQQKWLPADGLFEINKAQLDCREIVEHIPIFLNCLFFNVKSIRNRAEIREKGKMMREIYYRYLGVDPPCRRSLSIIPAKPERIIDSEIMEPSVASPRRSLKGEQVIKKEKQEKVSNAADLHHSQVNTTIVITEEKKVTNEQTGDFRDIMVVRSGNLQPAAAIVKSTSTGNMNKNEVRPQNSGTPVTKPNDHNLFVPNQEGVKRSISDGNLQKKETEIPPIAWDGLFERLAPGDDTERDGEALSRFASTATGRKLQPLLPPAIRKAMELKAREYVARPHIRTYSRTLYNMAEIEKWISPANPRNFYVLTHLLGQGAYGEVFCGRSTDQKDTQIFAIKVAVNLFDRPTKIHDITNEIRFLEECKHPNVVHHFKSYLWNKEIWTVMEYCEAGNLADVVQDVGLFSEEETCFITREILKGVAHLHRCNKIHRDLKGDNILLTSGAHIKIADFGLMTEADGDAGRTSICGSRYWMSPEMLRAEGYGTKSDIWSVGSIVYELLTDGPPYIRYRSLKGIFYTATRGVDPLENSEMYSPQFNTFLDCCFKMDPRRRFTAEELLNLPWIKDCHYTHEKLYYSLKHLFLENQ
eukprot:TRINITY_DN2118_c1_g1_i3.p1 TRINITY_DN2118_c1_g1~~TRINITY_DN2118_c1_g1_i3.p1  ORF type:complete len:593 (-),score=110.42 TRINITY_DN2118_c1_g1_i3:90-1868(-)